MSWGSLLILARLLSRADYGIGEMAGLYFVLTNMLAEFGVGTAVLHMPELSRRALGQLHTFSCLMCTGMFFLAVLGAPLIADFYRTPELKMVIIAGNTTLFITGFQAVPLGLLQRDMDYRGLSLAEAAQAIAQAVGSVLGAYFGLGYWALIIGATAGKIVNAAMVAYWKRVPFVFPRWKEVRPAVAMGGQVAVSRLAWSAYSSSDGIVVGRVLGDAMLGTYRMAMNLASAPAEKVSTLLMRTAGPLFANVQEDLSLVRRYFLIFAEAMSLIVLPLMVGLIMLAPLAIPVLLGPQWHDAVPPLQLLAVFTFLRTMGTLMDQVLISQRRAGLAMKMSLLNFVVMPTAFYFSAQKYGIAGVAGSWLVLSPLMILPSQIVMMRQIRLRVRDFSYVVWPAIACSASMALGLRFLEQWLSHSALPMILRLAMEVAGGFAIYASLLASVFRARLLRYLNFVRQLRSPKASGVEPAPVP